MTAFDSFPLGRPAFVTNILDRAAHLRGSDEKLFALEGHRDARAYVAVSYTHLTLPTNREV